MLRSRLASPTGMGQWAIVLVGVALYGGIVSAQTQTPVAATPQNGPLKTARPTAQALSKPDPLPRYWMSVEVLDGPVDRYLTEACLRLNDRRLLPSKRIRLAQGETVTRAYQKALGVPFSLVRMAQELNSKTSAELTEMQTGDRLIVPEVTTKVLEYNRTVNETRDSGKMVLDKLTTRSKSVVRDRLNPKLVSVAADTYRFVYAYRNRRQVEDAVETLREVARSINRGKEGSGDRTPYLKIDASIYYEDLEFKSFTQPPLAMILPLSTEGMDGMSAADLQSGGFWLGGLLGGSAPPNHESSSPTILRLFDQELKGHWALPSPELAAPTVGTAVIVADGEPDLNQIRALNQGPDHANHLAGIVAGNVSQEGFGVAGVSPGARVINYPVPQWATGPGLLDRFALELSHALQGDDTVVLSATDFSRRPFENRDEQLQHPVALAVSSSSPLWVVSAGHSENNAGGAEITFNTPLPRGMAWLPSVLGVTACERCDDRNFSLMDFANHGSEFVHVAAPDRAISLNASNGWARGSGTSQAAAFVAGVALEMLGRYSNCFREPRKLKERIQSTSMPVDDDRVAAGFIEFPVAMLDPKKAWRLADGASRLDGDGPDGYTPTEGFAPGQVLLEDFSGRILASGEILRIVRDSRDRWFVYEVDEPGLVAKKGPFLSLRIRGEEQEPAFEDLILQSCFP